MLYLIRKNFFLSLKLLLLVERRCINIVMSIYAFLCRRANSCVFIQITLPNSSAQSLIMLTCPPLDAALFSFYSCVFRCLLLITKRAQSISIIDSKVHNYSHAHTHTSLFGIILLGGICPILFCTPKVINDYVLSLSLCLCVSVSAL